MSNLHILKNSETEAVVKVYTTNSSGEDIDISLENDLTKSTQVYVAGSASVNELVSGDYATYTGSHVTITGIWWGAKAGKQIDIMRIVDPVAPTYHNHYYLTDSGYFDYKQAGFADRIYAHKDIRVSFVSGEGFCILRLTKQGWNPKVETAVFGIYDDITQVGS